MEKSFWTKTSDELNTTEQLGLVGLSVIVAIAAPFAALAAIGGVAVVSEKAKNVWNHRKAKKDK